MIIANINISIRESGRTQTKNHPTRNTILQQEERPGQDPAVHSTRRLAGRPRKESVSGWMSTVITN